MSRIGRRFEALHADGRRALIPYVTAGDPDPEWTVPLMHAMVGAGADLIELGVPFSDPMADGPVIQAACERALRHDVSLERVLELVAAFRESDRDTPVILMGYLNPIEVLGYDRFAERAAEAGVDGVLTVDMPPEEADELLAVIQDRDIDPIFLLSPTTSTERIARICRSARGFVYYVSLKGVTGASSLDVDTVAAKIAAIRDATELPVGVGFGIRDAESAARLSAVADGVVVGSALVQRIGDAADHPETMTPAVVELLSSMRGAIDKR